jgi:hypothetical protein
MTLRELNDHHIKKHWRRRCSWGTVNDWLTLHPKAGGGDTRYFFLSNPHCPKWFRCVSSQLSSLCSGRIQYPVLSLAEKETPDRVLGYLLLSLFEGTAQCRIRWRLSSDPSDPSDPFTMQFTPVINRNFTASPCSYDSFLEFVDPDVHCDPRPKACLDIDGEHLLLTGHRIAVRFERHAQKQLTEWYNPVPSTFPRTIPGLVALNLPNVWQRQITRWFEPTPSSFPRLLSLRHKMHGGSRMAVKFGKHQQLLTQWFKPQANDSTGGAGIEEIHAA